MQIFKKSIDRKYLSVLKSLPRSIKLHQGSPATAYFYDNKECYIGCLSCHNPRCIFLQETEINCDVVNNFPFEHSLNTCPVDAIKWDDSSIKPVIDNTKCISCGICVSRCPVGALYFSDAGKLMLNTEECSYVENKKADTNVQIFHLRQISNILNIPRSGMSLAVSDCIFEDIYDKLFRIDNAHQNIIVRNLLVALGCKCSTRRVGDVYTRMDAVYLSPLGSFGAIEIEFGKDTLEAVRGILDDIAVLNTRYGISKNINKAIVVCLQLPNARQGYWQVVRDIKNVTNIKIGTITVGALMILLWNGRIFKPEYNFYYLDYDNMDLRSIICKQLNCNDVPLNYKSLGILETMK